MCCGLLVAVVMLDQYQVVIINGKTASLSFGIKPLHKKLWVLLVIQSTNLNIASVCF